MFEWTKFLNDRNIEFVTSGRNLSKGNIGLHCPFCGEADKSHHMNISLRGRGWACWRDASHRGHSSAKLVQALISCSWSEAVRITGSKEAFVYSTEDLAASYAELYKDDWRGFRKLQPPKDWRPLHNSSGPTSNLLFGYLAERGYNRTDANWLAKKYSWQYSFASKWQKRLIFPIHNAQGDLVNYTGRSIAKNAFLRYKTMDGVEAENRMGHCLLDMQRLSRTQGKVLIVNEGPMDSTRVGWLSEPFGVYATCTFTAAVTEQQASMIAKLALNFERLIILFDFNAQVQAMRAQELLRGKSPLISPEIGEIPEGVKDPGELQAQHILDLCRDWVGFSM